MTAPAISEGVLRFSLDICVDMNEMKRWPPQCIRAFFDGISRAEEATNCAREAIASERRNPVASPAAARPRGDPT